MRKLASLVLSLSLLTPVYPEDSKHIKDSTPSQDSTHTIVTNCLTPYEVKIEYKPCKKPRFLTLFEKVSSEIEYKKEKGHDGPERTDYEQTPEETMKLGTGDCEDMTRLIMYHYKKNNISAKRISGWGNFSYFSRHSWIEIKYRGMELILDAASGKIYDKQRLKSDERSKNTLCYYVTSEDIYDYIKDDFKDAD